MNTHVGRIAERVVRAHRYIHGASPTGADRELSKTLSKYSVAAEQYAAEWAVCLHLFGSEFARGFATPHLFLGVPLSRIDNDVRTVVSTQMYPTTDAIQAEQRFIPDSVDKYIAPKPPKFPSFDEFKVALGKEAPPKSPAVTNPYAVPTASQPPKGNIMARKNLLQSEKFRELTGELYIDEQRVSGRTTTIALRTIAKAIETPNMPIFVTDHHGTAEADLALLGVIKAQVKALGLKFFEFKEADRAVQGAPSVTCNRLGE